MSNIPPVEWPYMVSPEKEPENDTPEQILDKIIAVAGDNWSRDQQEAVRGAYELASLLHADDEHRGQPYVYHLLRNASRIVRQLHVFDYELVVAVLLHDSVEDHADALLTIGDKEVPDDSVEAQDSALDFLAELTSERSAYIVKALTNPINISGIKKLPDDERQERLEDYARHVEIAVSDEEIGAWMGKFVDWVDNGVNIDKAESDMKLSRLRRLIEKYELIMPILEERYYYGVKATLVPEAQEYAEEMFDEGVKRLSKMKRFLAFGSVAITTE